MFETELFLAFPVTSQYEEALNAAPQGLKEAFINTENYLTFLQHEGVNYLGKSLGESILEEELKNAAKHICSILMKLVPTTKINPQHLKIITLLRS